MSLPGDTAMCRVILFGGTGEGRFLADYCSRHEIQTLVCVASGYGADLVPESGSVKVHTGAMDEEEMEALLDRQKPAVVVDATHPYASLVTENIRQACGHRCVPYVRVSREKEGEGKTGAGTVWVDTASEALSYLADKEGNILFATGSRTLPCFVGIPGFRERVFVRVLPDEEVIRQCKSLGLSGRQIIAMQGPFSAEMNRAMLKMTEARYLVTKESGRAGGFPEKLEAAACLGVTAVVIGRPKEREGIGLEEAVRLLAPLGRHLRRRVFLVGIGGGPGQLTQEAEGCIRQADGVAGARRMVESVSQLCAGKAVKVSYKPEEILGWLRENPQIEQAAVLYSGDTGFYSGAKAMAECLNRYPEDYQVSMVPGISTMSLLCARLMTGWEDICPASLHGRNPDLKKILQGHRRVFLLLGGENPVEELCKTLLAYGFDQIRMTVGVSLSYPEETMITGRPGELAGQEIHGLCAVLLEQEEGGTCYEG